MERILMRIKLENKYKKNKNKKIRIKRIKKGKLSVKKKRIEILKKF